MVVCTDDAVAVVGVVVDVDGANTRQKIIIV
jgi:hypothetical protein